MSISDRALQLTAERRSITGSDGNEYDFASGMVTTGPPADGEPAKLAFRYGRVEARVQSPSGRGTFRIDSVTVEQH